MDKIIIKSFNLVVDHDGKKKIVYMEECKEVSLLVDESLCRNVELALKRTYTHYKIDFKGQFSFDNVIDGTIVLKIILDNLNYIDSQYKLTNVTTSESIDSITKYFSSQYMLVISENQ